MAKEYAKHFYSSKAWQHCREAYRKSVGGLCERCRAQGRIVAGEIVHHKEHITPETINDPTVLLAWDNLELVCRECHAIEHGALVKRYEIGADGTVAPLSEKNR